jgi:hypothetical protein
MSDDPDNPIVKWNAAVQRVRDALNEFDARDALLIFGEWLQEQVGVTYTKDNEANGFEEFFITPVDRDQDTIYLTILEA